MEIGNLDNIPLEAVVTIANDLKQKVAFLPAPKEFSRGGGESMAKILSQMDADEAQQYLDQIQVDDIELYNDIKQYYHIYTTLRVYITLALFSFFFTSYRFIDNRVYLLI